MTRAVQPVPGGEVLLGGELRRAVGRQREPRRVLAGRRVALAVDRATRRGEDHLGVVRAGRLEHVHRPEHVRPRVGDRVGDRDPDVDLRGEMEDDLGLRLGEDLRERVADVARRGASRRGATCSRRPELRSSTTCTSSPRVTSASTSVDPMKPAPPVTTARTAVSYARDVHHLRGTRRLGQDDPGAAPRRESLTADGDRRRLDARAGRHAARRGDPRPRPARRPRRAVGGDRALPRRARAARRAGDPTRARARRDGRLRPVPRHVRRLPGRRPRARDRRHPRAQPAGGRRAPARPDRSSSRSTSRRRCARVGDKRDRIERAEAEFWPRVVDAYRTLAARFPERYVVVDGPAPGRRSQRRSVTVFADVPEQPRGEAAARGGARGRAGARLPVPRACRRRQAGGRACVRAALLGDERRVDAGTHPDLQVIEALGDMIRIDEIRALHHDLHMRPFEADRRVYLLFDAHRMNDEATAALLKDLEEPPAYATLVLVADELGPLPETIRSRCQLVPFRRLSRAAVEEWLAGAGARSGRAARSAALARVAGGRLDRAARLLDQDARAQRAALLDAARGAYLDDGVPSERRGGSRSSRAARRAARRRDEREQAGRRRPRPSGPRGGAARPAGRRSAPSGRSSSPRSTTSPRGTATSWSSPWAPRAQSSTRTGSTTCAPTSPAESAPDAEDAAALVRQAWREAEEFNLNATLAARGAVRPPAARVQRLPSVAR